MNNFYKKAAAREGFTLVELIVVIAILAILAAVAYPAYTGYIAKANEAADRQILSSVATAGQGLAAEYGGAQTITVTVKERAVEEITITATTTHNFTKDEIELLVGPYTALTFKSDKYGGAKTTSGYEKMTITWTNNGGSGKWDPAKTTG